MPVHDLRILFPGVALAACSDCPAHNAHLSIPDLFPTIYSSFVRMHAFSSRHLTNHSSSWAVANQDHPTSCIGGASTVSPEHPAGNNSVSSAALTAGKHPQALMFFFSMLTSHHHQLFTCQCSNSKLCSITTGVLGAPLCPSHPLFLFQNAVCEIRSDSLLHRAHSCAGWYLAWSASL